MATLADILGFIDDPDKYRITIDGHEVKFIDDYGLSCGSNGEWFVAGHEFGPHVLVHASDFEGAWEAWIDESPTIPKEELIEAYSPGGDKGSFFDEAIDAYRSASASFQYGRWTDEDWAKIKASAKSALDAMASAAGGPQGSDEYPEIVQGYELQSNASGTGIVDVGDYAMNEADLSKVEVTRKEKE